MKCNVDDLPRVLDTTIKPIYCITGDDPFLLNQAGDTIRQHLRAQGYLERIRIVADAKYDWTELQHSLSEQSLFAEKRLFDIHVPNATFGDRGGKTLQAISLHPSLENILLISTSKLDASRQRAKWFKAIEQSGLIVTVWPLDSGRMAQWLRRKFTANGYQIAPDALQYLVDQTEGNLTAAHQEMEKLMLLFPPGKLSLSALDQAIANNARFDVFKFVDASLSGNARRCTAILDRLRHQGTEPVLVLWALTREIRTLIGCCQKRAQNQALSQFARQFGIWPQRQPLISQALQRLSSQTLYTLLQKAAAVDKGIKGLSAADPWRDLRDLALKLAGHPILEEASW